VRFITVIWAVFQTVWSEVMRKTMWGAWLVTSCVVALAGPFGTFETQPFQWRFLYWGGVIAVAIFMGLTARTVLRHLLKDQPALVEDLSVAVLLALTFGPTVVWINQSIGGEAAREAMGLGLVMFSVFSIACCIIAVRRTIEQSASSPQVARQDRLLSRLPVPEGARLSRISSDNHHIRIVTITGDEHRLLMRLRDAVDEIDVEAGFCVHRSHWVAKSAIAGVAKEGKRELVELVCGSKIPIGPKYRNNLVEAGVISD